MAMFNSYVSLPEGIYMGLSENREHPIFPMVSDYPY